MEGVPRKTPSLSADEGTSEAADREHAGTRGRRPEGPKRRSHMAMIGVAIALETIMKTIKDFDANASHEVHLNDARTVREEAAVVANAVEEEIVLALKVLKKQPAAVR